jgi:cell division protease FtsH
MTRGELETRMAVLLGGRAAETLVFDQVSTGAADDLAKVTDIARSMVTRFGMVEKLGQVTFEDAPHSFLGTPPPSFGQERKYSEETAREIDCAVREIVQRAFETAVGILRSKRPVLELTANALLEKETLTESDLRSLVTDVTRSAA